jgi:hypothetical protein
MRPLTSAALVCAALLSAAAACPTASPAPPVAFREVTSGCSGGFTGGGGGAVLLADGRLYRWQTQVAGRPETRTLVRTDTALAADVRRRLTEMRFLELEHSAPSNVTCSLSVRTDTAEHSVAWPLDDPGAPKPVRELFDRLQAAVR